VSRIEPITDDDRFGPSALLTPANAVTIIRMLLSPALLVMILDEPSSWGAMSLWIALAVTDGVDGALARRFGTTRSGAFLDPLADKILVLGALFALVAADRFWWFPVALITAREVVISVFRTQLGRQGLAVPARFSAKVKTVTQEVAVGLALLPLTVDHPFLAGTALWLAVGLTLFSGAQYLVDGRSAATTLGRRTAPGT
jgi:CDP-diacylglycerol--glycerol-3-phosphate 3-phosphatidyltransferase